MAENIIYSDCEKRLIREEKIEPSVASEICFRSEQRGSGKEEERSAEGEIRGEKWVDG